MTPSTERRSTAASPPRQVHPLAPQLQRPATAVVQHTRPTHPSPLPRALPRRAAAQQHGGPARQARPAGGAPRTRRPGHSRRPHCTRAMVPGRARWHTHLPAGGGPRRWWGWQRAAAPALCPREGGARRVPSNVNRPSNGSPSAYEGGAQTTGRAGQEPVRATRSGGAQGNATSGLACSGRRPPRPAVAAVAAAAAVSCSAADVAVRVHGRGRPPVRPEEPLRPAGWCGGGPPTGGRWRVQRMPPGSAAWVGSPRQAQGEIPGQHGSCRHMAQ